MKTRLLPKPAGQIWLRPARSGHFRWRNEAAAGLLGVMAAWMVGPTASRAGEWEQFFDAPLEGRPVGGGRARRNFRSSRLW